MRSGGDRAGNTSLSLAPDLDTEILKNCNWPGVSGGGGRLAIFLLSIQRLSDSRKLRKKDSFPYCLCELRTSQKLVVNTPSRPSSSMMQKATTPEFPTLLLSCCQSHHAMPKKACGSMNADRLAIIGLKWCAGCRAPSCRCRCGCCAKNNQEQLHPMYTFVVHFLLCWRWVGVLESSLAVACHHHGNVLEVETLGGTVGKRCVARPNTNSPTIAVRNTMILARALSLRSVFRMSVNDFVLPRDSR